jgi:hypothetical protein
MNDHQKIARDQFGKKSVEFGWHESGKQNNGSDRKSRVKTMEVIAKVGSTMCSLAGSRSTATKRGWALLRERRQTWSKMAARADGGGDGADTGVSLPCPRPLDAAPSCLVASVVAVDKETSMDAMDVASSLGSRI